MANTGTPRVVRSMAARAFPTPEPGVIPAVDSCTAAHSRSGSQDATASTAITASGWICRTAAASSSALSIPVVPRTPGAMALTVENGAKTSGIVRFKCRVTIRFRSASGPTASGVTASLPSPATRTCAPTGSSARMCRDSSADCAAKAAGSCAGIHSSVTYVPRGFPSARSPAEIVFVLPNNKNIILAAQAAAELAEKDVIVIESKTVPQGITALLNFDAELDVQENTAAMTASLSTVTTMQVTYAARNSDFDGHDIHEGDYLGLCDGALLAVTPDLTAILTKMAEKTGAEDHSFINIFYGCDISEADAEAARDIFAQHAPDAEINLLSGGQPIYYYLISAE